MSKRKDQYPAGVQIRGAQQTKERTVEYSKQATTLTWNNLRFHLLILFLISLHLVGKEKVETWLWTIPPYAQTRACCCLPSTEQVVMLCPGEQVCGHACLQRRLFVLPVVGGWMAQARKKGHILSDRGPSYCAQIQKILNSDWQMCRYSQIQFSLFFLNCGVCSVCLL